MKINSPNIWTIATTFLILFAPLVSNQVVNAAPIGSISLVKSGLVAYDPLDNETKTEQQLKADTRYWRYGGSADEINAPRAFHKDTQGLHIGVQAPANGTYAGYYAVSPGHDTKLFHAVITTPVRTIPSTTTSFQNGIYVQTTQPYINYISCVSNTGTSGTVWTVGHSYSTPFTAVIVEQLWVDTSPNQPLTRECTIITNGDNYLKVYVDGVMVYSSSTLKLVMPPPFEFFLEPQSNYAGQMLFGTYRDYYTTSNETIQIINNPATAKTVYLKDSSGNIVASAPVSNGKAVVDVGKYHFPLVANIEVSDSSDSLIASTSSAVNIFGGDVYSVTITAVPLQPPTGLTATAASSSQINLSWNAPSDNGGSPITGYMIERSTDNGATWSTIIANTASASTAYSDTGLSANTTYTYRVSAINSAGTSSPSNTASATTRPITAAPVGSISLVKSGLVAHDPLDNETKTQQELQANPRYWTFYGSAAGQQGAKYTYSKDAQGLHIGVQSPVTGVWSGFFAVSPNTTGSLYHLFTTLSYTSMPTSESFNTGLYVQTWDHTWINYIGCVAVSTPSGYWWTVVQAFGPGTGSATITTLYQSPVNNQPLAQDCTIITNGDNYLKVYLGGQVVVNRNNLTLMMSPPFNAYLEPQTTSASSMHFGTYTNYYATSNEEVRVTNASPSGTAKIVDSSNRVLASAPVAADGSANMLVGMYNFPLNANIQVYDSNNQLVASTSSPIAIWGGDVYSVSISVVPPKPPTGLTANAVSSSQINLSWNAPSDNGGSPITGYMIERSTDNGATWSTIVANTASTATAYSDTGLAAATTYSYRVSAINSVGTSSPSNIASATTGSASTAPQPPTNLSATAGNAQVSLSWSAPTNNGGSPVTGYKIERSTDGATWSTIVSNTGSTATTFNDTGLAASTTYTYRVSAINSVGPSSPSNTASATTTTVSPPASAIVLNGVQTTSGTISTPPFQIKLSDFNASTGQNRLLVVGVQANNNDVASITFGGVQLTKKVQSFYWNDAEFWYLVNPTGTGDIVVTMNGPTSVVVGAYSISGVDQANPIPTKATKHKSASSPTISITTAYQNSLVLDLPSIWGGVTLGSPTCTQQWDVSVPGAITGASSSTVQASPGSVTCQWTASNGDDWDDVAIEIKASG